MGLKDNQIAQLNKEKFELKKKSDEVLEKYKAYIRELTDEQAELRQQVRNNRKKLSYMIRNEEMEQEMMK